MNLDGSEATPVGDVHADMLKQTTDIHLPIRLKQLICLLTINLTLMI